MLYQCFCKATNREDKEPRYSHNWVTARRAMFKVFEDRVMCGDWIINRENFESAKVYRTSQMFIPVTVLHVITSNGSYQFGFNPWANPIKYLPFDFTSEKVKLEEENVRLKYSPFSIVIRVALVAYILYLFFGR